MLQVDNVCGLAASWVCSHARMRDGGCVLCSRTRAVIQVAATLGTHGPCASPSCCLHGSTRPTAGRSNLHPGVARPCVQQSVPCAGMTRHDLTPGTSKGPAAGHASQPLLHLLTRDVAAHTRSKHSTDAEGSCPATAYFCRAFTLLSRRGRAGRLSLPWQGLA